MKHTILILATILTIASCSGPVERVNWESDLIPAPLSSEKGDTYFSLSAKSYILTTGEASKEAGEYLAEQLEFHTGIRPVCRDSKKLFPGSYIELLLDTAGSYASPEAYELCIDNKKLLISASKPEGLLMGIQSLRQIIHLHSVKNAEGIWEVPTARITDAPNYEYRGAMLDVARHFFGVDDVKRYIDLLALYKINILHLHLSDDQGWRIEIKSWPLLTETGGLTQVGGGEGGFYSQEEYMDIVDYAAKRYITIVPEIDVPGHTNAALASYAELNCDKKKRKPYTGTKVGFSTLCTTNDTVYSFVKDVITELVEMTPGPYIHIGGDESHVTPHDKYVSFISKVQEIVSATGKIMIGWDEISAAEIDTSSICHFWANKENAGNALAKGHKLLFSPAEKAYLDIKYDSSTVLGLTWAGLTEVDDAYLWTPMSQIEGIEKTSILGIEAPLWGETIETIDDIEFLAFPRIMGHAEIGWSEIEDPDWEEYRLRLAKHAALLDLLDVNYYRSPLVDWE